MSTFWKSQNLPHLFASADGENSRILTSYKEAKNKSNFSTARGGFQEFRVRLVVEC